MRQRCWDWDSSRALSTSLEIMKNLVIKDQLEVTGSHFKPSKQQLNHNPRAKLQAFLQLRLLPAQDGAHDTRARGQTCPPSAGAAARGPPPPPGRA